MGLWADHTLAPSVSFPVYQLSEDSDFVQKD